MSLKRPSYSRDRLTVIVAVLGAVLVAVGAWLLYPPVGVVVAGVECLTAAYVVRYLEVKSEVA